MAAFATQGPVTFGSRQAQTGYAADDQARAA